MSIILKVITHLGQLSGYLKDFEQDAKDLFAGKLTKDEATQFLADLKGILGSGLVSIPGIDIASVIATLDGGEQMVSDVIATISDVKTQGVAAVAPDVKKAATDLIAAIEAGAVAEFGGFNAGQAKELLQGIVSSL